MSVIPITITWDAKRAKIVGVSPDPVRLTWIDNDVAQFQIKTEGDDKVRLVDVWFEGEETKGPFKYLRRTPYTHGKAWTGAGLAHVTKEYKYSVSVEGTNGKDELDPRMKIEEGP